MPELHNIPIAPAKGHPARKIAKPKFSPSPIPLAKSLSLSAIPDSPITIRTSKKWVLPPRPKPGRKPSSAKKDKKKPRRKAAKDKKKSVKAETKKSAEEASPIKQKILKINEENYYLKLEVIKLVGDLETMRKKRGLDGVDLKGIPDSLRLPPSAIPRSDPLRSPADFGKMGSSPELLSRDDASNPRKRPHEDINDLIVSLVDLNHTRHIHNKTRVVASASPESIDSDSPDLLDLLSLDSRQDLVPLSEDEDTLSTTPSSVLQSIRTNSTSDSMSGTTLVSSHSPAFKLLDIPEGEKEVGFSLLGGPASLVDEGLFGQPPQQPPALNPDDNTYEFDGLNDVEMEFDNFVHGNDLELR